MHLIHVESQKLEHFNKDEDIPLYAILSHTWIEGSEVSLQEWKDGLSTNVKKKIWILQDTWVLRKSQQGRICLHLGRYVR